MEELALDGNSICEDRLKYIENIIKYIPKLKILDHKSSIIPLDFEKIDCQPKKTLDQNPSYQRSRKCESSEKPKRLKSESKQSKDFDRDNVIKIIKEQWLKELTLLIKVVYFKTKNKKF